MGLGRYKDRPWLSRLTALLRTEEMLELRPGGGGARRAAGILEGRSLIEGAWPGLSDP